MAPWVDPELAAIVHRGLARQPDARWASMDELIAALAPHAGGEELRREDFVMVSAEQRARVVITRPSYRPGADGPTINAVAASHPGTPPPRRGRLAIWAGVALVVLGAAALARSGGGRAGATAAPASTDPTAAPAPLGPTSLAVTVPSNPSPVGPAEDIKVGLLTVKMPAGYTLKVDGFTPGSPGSTSAPSKFENGRLELRGEFQRKFLVAIFDANGKRVMVQDVYLYDNKVEPDSLDTSVGAVAVVEAPRKPASAAPRTAGAPAAPAGPVAKPVASTSELPARF